MQEKYHPFLRILHWVMAVLVITMIFLGWFMEYLEDVIGKTNPTRLFLYDLHKSLGVIVLVLIVIRIIARIVTFAPPLPQTMQPLIRIAAKSLHYTLYTLMVVTPLAGYAMSDSFGKGVKLFGLPLPRILSVNKELGKTLSELHSVFAYTLLALIVIHIAAAIWHRFFDKRENDTLPRIL
jgi:cytochrome b561